MNKMSNNELEPAAWRASCSNDCGWANTTIHKTRVPYNHCPWCKDEDVSIEPHAVEISDVRDLIDEFREDNATVDSNPAWTQTAKDAVDATLEALEKRITIENEESAAEAGDEQDE